MKTKHEYKPINTVMLPQAGKLAKQYHEDYINEEDV